MPLATPPTTGTDQDDFRRLGVRPDECRTWVIRIAATRKARALAQQQLTAPTEQAEMQLSLVATSAYRLLDPRQRQDPLHRAYVGRVLPGALGWAGQTTFSSSSPQGASSPGTLFGHLPVSDEELTELLDLDSDPLPPRGDESSWAISLDDGDLINRGTRRRLTDTYLGSLRSWMLLIMAGLAVGTVLGLATLRRDSGESIRDRSPIAPRHASPTEDALTSDSPTAVDRSVVPQPLASASGDVATELPPPVAAASEFPQPDTARVGPEPTAAEPTAAEPTVLEPMAIESVSASEGNIGTENPLDAAGPAPSAGPLPTMAADGFLPDPFVSRPAMLAPRPLGEMTESDLSPSAPADASAAGSDFSGLSPMAPEPTAERHPVPDDASLRAAREQLLVLLPQAAQTVAPDEIAAVIAQLERLADGLKIGSADHWAARMLVAEFAWLVEDAAEVGQRLKTLADHYATPVQQPLADSFVAASSLASLPETHRHLLDNGFPLADQLLLDAFPELGQRVIGAMVSSAATIDSESEQALLEEWAQAAEQMRRLAESAQRMIDDSGNVIDDSADLGILGRYYCLMLRRWEVGLPWLVHVSDSRIASIARQEVELDRTAPAEERVRLAELWLQVAPRSRGRTADAIRLHAIDLLRLALVDLSGLRKLEVERQIEQAEETLPAFLRGAPAGPVVPASGQEALTPPTADRPASPDSGLSGRIQVAGQDVGVQLHYQLGVALTQTVVDTIARSLDRTLPQPSIAMQGEFELQQATTVEVSIAAPQPEAVQEVRLAGRPLEFDASGNAELLLPAGSHEIAWLVSAERLPRLYLRVGDASSGSRIEVLRPSVADHPALPTVLTVGLQNPE
jgi:hypothetical protein